MIPQKLPADTLRDLLGICRALYRVRSEAGANPDELDRISKAGKALSQALKFSKLDVNSIGHRAGWEWADTGLAQLVECLADAGATGAELARTAGEKLKRKS